MAALASASLPKYLQEEEILSEECRELISSLPKERGWLASNVYKYKGYWYPVRHLQGVISCQKLFKAQDSDIFLITSPKSGTTWLKSILFSLINRNQYHPISKNHPLLHHNPHDLVPFLEIKLYIDNVIPDLSSVPPPRLFSTHIPYTSLPESIKYNPASKIVYLCRNQKDVFASLWHFTNELMLPKTKRNDISDVFDRFCNGISLFGPYWDHVLEYWNKSKENPDWILFLKFEDMKNNSIFVLRRLAEFLG